MLSLGKFRSGVFRYGRQGGVGSGPIGLVKFWYVSAGGLRLLVVLYVGVSYVKVRQARRVSGKFLTSFGMFRQASWGSLVLGKFRYVVFSFWLGRCGAVRPCWVGRGTSRCD